MEMCTPANSAQMLRILWAGRYPHLNKGDTRQFSRVILTLKVELVELKL